MSNQPEDQILATSATVLKNVTQDNAEAGFLSDALAVIRKHLHMDVAFLSEFTGGERAFRYIDSAEAPQPLQPNCSNPLEESYCQRIVDGRLPPLIPDTRDLPEARNLEVTRTLSIGAYMGVPIVLKNGDVFGTLCCFSHQPDQSLNESDLNIIRVFADLAARQFERERAAKAVEARMRSEIQACLRGNDLNIVYQPIYDLERERVAGFEALSRFATEPKRTPDLWFAQAARVGLGVELELKAVEKALEGFRDLPPDAYVSLNVSADTILSGRLEAVLAQAPCERIVLEVTEHEVITEYEKVASALGQLRRRGLRIAVDDVGAGYANFRHIIKLAPDLIKLDMSLTRDIDSNRAGRAFASAVIKYARDMESTIVAEGVETVSELLTLRDIGVAGAQGYLLGRPVRIEEAAQLYEIGAAFTRQVE